MATRVQLQQASKDRRKMLLDIISKNDKTSISDITKIYLINMKVIKNSDEFNHLPYEKRVNWINVIRYHLNKMVNDGVLISNEVSSLRGPFLKKVYKVIKK